MVSILIPVLNQTITDLVEDLQEQGKRLGIPFEIIVLDDGSESSFSDHNRVVGQWEHVTYLTGSSNMGRAAARNQLARHAKHPYLIFIDCDAAVPSEEFLARYMDFLTQEPVVCGGTVYQATPPENKELLLRWEYGKTRESVPAKRRNKNPHAGFSGFNFLIDKELFLTIQFDETLREYGHEDTLFGYKLWERGSNVLHIDNPLIHLGLEPDHLFIRKTKAGLENLYHLTRLYNERREFTRMVRLLRVYYRVRKTGVLPLSEPITRKLLKRIEGRMLSSKPNLLFFDLFKLLYYSSLYF